jgi:hypothetical protein
LGEDIGVKMKRLKQFAAGSVILLFILMGASVLLWLRPYEKSRAVPARADADVFDAERFQSVPVIEDELTPFDTMNPLHRKTRAEELLETFPAGTEVYEFKVERPGTERIWRSPGGRVFIERETGIVEIDAYRKPESSIGFEFRPAIIGYAGAGAGPGLAVGLARVKKIHVGPAATYDVLTKTASVGGTITYNIWQNLDTGIYAGKRFGARRGCSGGALVAIAMK